MKNIREVGAVVCVSMSLAAVWTVWAEPASFSRLGAIPGNIPANTAVISQAYGVSPDGSTLVGSAFDPAVQGLQAAFWTRSSGLVSIGSIAFNALPTNAFATAASSTGNVIVGTSVLPSGVRQAFRWTSVSNTIAPLDTLPDNTVRTSAANDVDQTGNIVVGDFTPPGNTFVLPFVWTPGQGFRAIDSGPALPFGTASTISKNGLRVFGAFQIAASARTIFEWTDPFAGGSGLFFLPTPATLGNAAFDSSDDGFVVVGCVTEFGQSPRAFRWTDPRRGGSGLELLPLLSDVQFASMFATGVSDDGKVIVGFENLGTGLTRPFIWTVGRSTELLSTYMSRNGLATPGFILTTADGISGDGQFIVGNGIDVGTGRSEGWHLFVPRCPGDFNENGQVDFFDYLDFAQAFADESPSADFNRNGTIDFFDYLDFVAVFDAGCP